MRQEQTVELGLKLTAIFCLMYGLTHLGSYLMAFFVPDFEVTGILWVSAFGPVALPILLALVIFFMARKWSTKIVQVDDNNDVTKLTANEFQLVATSLLGTFIILTNFVPLFYLIVRMVQTTQASNFEGFGFVDYLPLLAYIVIILAGVFLMFRASGVVGFVRKLRYAGA